MTLPKIDAMELIQTAKAVDDADWLFEVKNAGFRSPAYIDLMENRGTVLFAAFDLVWLTGETCAM